MFESVSRGAANAPRYVGIEARQALSQASATESARHRHGASGMVWLKAALAEIDYGVLLLDEAGHVLFANPVAHAEMRGDHPLHLAGDFLRAADPRDTSILNAAIDGASRRSLRKLVSLRTSNDELVNLSVVPLCGLAEPDGGSSRDAQPRNAVLVMLGKRRIGGELAIEAFARLHGLSAGETRVLLALSRGVQPNELARQHGVAISTIRTQIGNIRAKIGAGSIRDLLSQVTALPPLLGILHREQGSALPCASVCGNLVRLPA